jgi:5-methylcytosine-specific restriction endonuclease McrA
MQQKIINRIASEFSRFVRPARSRPNSQIWAALRSLVFARDDFTCQYCGIRGARLECDHIVPVSRGGGDFLENLTTACFGCNRSKRNKLLSEWRR